MTNSYPSNTSNKGDLLRGLNILNVCYNAADLITETQQFR